MVQSVVPVNVGVVTVEADPFAGDVTASAGGAADAGAAPNVMIDAATTTTVASATKCRCTALLLRRLGRLPRETPGFASPPHDGFAFIEAGS